MNTVPSRRIESIGSNWYRLIEDYIYKWETDGVEYKKIVPEGFKNDLASIPRFLQWYISPFVLAPAAVPHDWPYHRKGNLPFSSQFTV